MAAIAALVVGLSSCSASTSAGPDSGSEASIAPVQPSEAREIIQLAFDMQPYPRGVEELQVTVEGKLYESCMAESGFGYVPLKYDADPSPFGDADAVLLRVPTVAEVELAGYEALDVTYDSPLKINDAAIAQNEKSSQESGWREAMDDCAIEVDEIWADLALAAPEIWSGLLPSFIDAVRPPAETAEVPAIQSWVKCMADHGYSFTSPMEAVISGTTISSEQGLTPSPDEVGIATTDLSCRNSSGYFDWRASAHATQAANWMEENAAVLAELRVAFDEDGRKLSDYLESLT